MSVNIKQKCDKSLKSQSVADGCKQYGTMYHMAVHGKVEGKPSDDHDETLTEARLLPILIKIECDTR